MSQVRSSAAAVIALGTLAAAPTAEAEACIGRMLKITGAGIPDLTRIEALRSVCEQMALAQYRAQTDAATARIYEAQLTQNTIILWLVVTLTMAGVILAAVQLWASYRLAARGIGALADGGAASLERGKIVVRSSVVGVIILALSFAFFAMYVLYVYQIGETDRPGAAPPADTAGAQRVPS